jgi:SsrA-binding protein
MADYAFNRKTLYEYEILQKYEAGLALTGQEVKSIRAGRISLQGAYVVIKNEEAHLLNADIPPYQAQNLPADYNPTRTRKLLLHKSEIRSLIGQSKQLGLTLVPLRVYNKAKRIKLEFALARGKRQFDKRQKIAKHDAQRQIDRATRGKPDS